MDGEEEASFVVRLLGAAFLLLLAASSLIWFIYSAVDLTVALYDMPPVIKFDKGSMYSLGASIGFFSLLVGVVQNNLFGKKLSQKREAFLIKNAIIGLAIMLVLPQIAHYTVSELIPKERYIICKEVSYQWMMYKNIVYTNNQITCDRLIKEQEIQISQPWF